MTTLTCGAGVWALAVAAAMMVPAVAIPALAVGGLGTRPRQRFAVALLLLALVAGAGAAIDGGPPTLGPLSVGYGVLAAVVLVATLRAWGRVSVVSWVVAALTMEALGGLRQVMQAPTGVERLGGALSVLVCLSLGALVTRWSARAVATSSSS